MDRINWVTSEALHAVLQLARTQDAEPKQTYARMRVQLETTRRRAAEAGYAESEQVQIAYALTALADEVAMAQEGALREHWAQHPLQLQLFGDNVAGERFFDELERARQAGRVGVLRTYYLCLLFGFRGRYAMRGGESGLAQITEGVRTQLLRSLAVPEQLAPDGARPEQGLVEVTRRMPWPVLAAGALMLSMVLYLGCKVSLREQLAQFTEQAP
ncbi:MAG TPA: DotU family type IV/VI secretion system protein [Polyangiales bacterium]|nr:DotU family type IV/VI secretion system protein [Polyangiales bacterium]